MVCDYGAAGLPITVRALHNLFERAFGQETAGCVKLSRSLVGITCVEGVGSFYLSRVLVAEQFPWGWKERGGIP